MFRVEMRPQWQIGHGEPTAEDWVSALGFAAPNADDSTFATADAAAVVLSYLKFYAETAGIASREFRVVETE